MRLPKNNFRAARNLRRAFGLVWRDHPSEDEVLFRLTTYNELRSALDDRIGLVWEWVVFIEDFREVDRIFATSTQQAIIKAFGLYGGTPFVVRADRYG